MPYKRTGKPPGRPKKPSKILVDGLPRPNLTEAQWKALRAEFELLGEKERHIGGWPQNVPLRAVATRACVERQTISKWRKTAPYQAGLSYLIGIAVSDRVDQRLKTEGEEGRSWFTPIPENKREFYIWEHVSLNWPKEGRVVSPINGKVYTTQESYIQHLLEAGVVPSQGLRPSSK